MYPISLWTSPDVARQYHSPYAYGDPVNAVDPDGLAKFQMALYLTGGRYYHGDLAGDYFTISRPELDAWASSITKELNDAGIKDLEVRVVTTPAEALQFLSQGKYNALLGHGSARQATLSNSGKDESFDLKFSDLENTAVQSHTIIDIFACFSGKYSPKYPHLKGESTDANDGSSSLFDAKLWLKDMFKKDQATPNQKTSK